MVCIAARPTRPTSPTCQTSTSQTINPTRSYSKKAPLSLCRRVPHGVFCRSSDTSDQSDLSDLNEPNHQRTTDRSVLPAITVLQTGARSCQLPLSTVSCRWLRSVEPGAFDVDDIVKCFDGDGEGFDIKTGDGDGIAG